MKEAADLLFWNGKVEIFRVPKNKTYHTHGTGCTYSAAITALLARGETLVGAVREAKDFISRAIASAPGLGHGHGPVNHGA